VKQPSYYAFFDVDGTLLNMTSMLSFLDFCHKHYYSNKLYGKFLSICYQFKRAVLFVNRDRNFLNQLYYRNYKGMQADNVCALGNNWFSNCVLSKSGALNSSSIKQLKKHQKNGAHIILVTGAFEACVAPIAKFFNVNHILCVQPEKNNGKYTGNIKGIQTIGKGKAEAIKAFLESQNIDNDELNKAYAYGDHVSDIPMLEMVAHPCVVKNSNSQLLKYAQQRKWAIV
jgi:HAD superfamily hydrolase (TIGR01490 family)